MMIFWQARLVVLSVPKTGSMALQAALWPHADMGVRAPPFYRHMTRAWFERRWLSQFRPEERGALETLAVVREPLDWLSSWYRYRLRDEIAGTPESTRGLGFDAFLDGWLAATPPAPARVGRQSRFCAAVDGSAGIDHLFAYEDPARLHAFLEDRLGQSLTIPRRNVSPRADVQASDTMRRRVQDEAPEEYALHGSALGASG